MGLGQPGSQQSWPGGRGCRGPHQRLRLGGAPPPPPGMRGRQPAWCPVGRRRWKLCPDGQMRHDRRAGPGGGGLGRASSVPCTSVCPMPCGYFYSCQGNSVIYGRPGPLQGCVINTPGPTLSFTWRGSSGPVLCGLSPASLPGLPGSCPHGAFLRGIFPLPTSPW